MISENGKARVYKKYSRRNNVKKIKAFLDEHKKEDPCELTGKLKEMFSEWREELEEKGVLPEYLAYAFAYKLKQFGYDRMMFELSKKRLGDVV